MSFRVETNQAISSACTFHLKIVEVQTIKGIYSNSFFMWNRGFGDIYSRGMQLTTRHSIADNSSQGNFKNVPDNHSKVNRLFVVMNDTNNTRP
jgi:hypothetical protein